MHIAQYCIYVCVHATTSSASTPIRFQAYYCVSVEYIIKFAFANWMIVVVAGTK